MSNEAPFSSEPADSSGASLLTTAAKCEDGKQPWSPGDSARAKEVRGECEDEAGLAMRLNEDAITGCQLMQLAVHAKLIEYTHRGHSPPKVMMLR
jgi:hypothetical protein